MSRLDWRPTNYQEIEESKNAFQVTSTVEQNEGTQKRGFLSHIRRYWYYYLPGSLLGLAVTLIILFVAIIPAVVQGIVNKNDLPVYSAKLTAPGPNSVQMSLASSIDTPTAFTTTLKPLNLSLAGENDTNVFTSIVLPEKVLNGKTPIEVTDQTATVTDINSFESFLASAMYNKNFTMQVSGKSDIFLGAIKSPITLNKTIELAGLNNLTGFALNNPQLLTTAQADGTNFLGTAMIPNPSVFSIELGNLTLNLAVNNISIGNAAIQNAYLSPGSNNLPLKATISLTTIISNLNTIIALQPAFTTNGTLEILATGNTTTFNGQRLTYYEKILNPLVLKSILPVRQLLAGGSAASTSSGNSSGNSTMKSVNPLMAKLARRLEMASRPVNVGKKRSFTLN